MIHMNTEIECISENKNKFKSRQVRFNQTSSTPVKGVNTLNAEKNILKE